MPHTPALIYFKRVNDAQKSTAKLEFLEKASSLRGIEWQELQPDERHTWITEGMQADFESFLPIGRKEAKAEKNVNVPTIFKNYGRGVATCRDDWAYDFHKNILIDKIHLFIDTYNKEVDYWKRRGNSSSKVDDF